MNNYDLLECSIMGIADYIYNTSNRAPEWMNKDESKAWKIGYERAKRQCIS